MQNITFNATNRLSNIGTPGTNVSGSHSIPINNNNAIVILFVTWNAGIVSSVTYGGIAMRFIVNVVPSSSMSAYVLENPPTGSQTVSVTTSLSATIIADIISYTEVNPYNSINKNATNTGTGGTSLSTNIIPTTDKSYIVAFSRSNGTNALAGTGFTVRTGASNIILADTNGVIDRNVIATLTTNYIPSGANNGHILLALNKSGNGGLI